MGRYKFTVEDIEAVHAEAYGYPEKPVADNGEGLRTPSDYVEALEGRRRKLIEMIRERNQVIDERDDMWMFIEEKGLEDAFEDWQAEQKAKGDD